MKRLLYISLILTVLFACKNDSMDTLDNPAAFASTISGTWKLVAVERSSIDNKNVWEPVPAAQADTLIFRGDGLILYGDGSPRCCAPKSLVINGNLMDIKPQTAIPANPLCARVNCVYCPSWDLSLTGNQLIISSCLGFREKYVR
ncbi:hypothetical protein [Dyadobacter sp. CY323]|uniref:hypothetical protein n=1 Tax=Dyadobacter sp. CY323 TaxID=2907302 RepID=UPI001F440545|nr:hypothetical protein [Dyadobacter sp. CY323]MCE6991638.1 hypothetical protein [Dyadobacter sp. CY323]